MKSTVKDVTKLAKVSPATGSNAFRNRRSLRFVIFRRHGHVVTDTPFFSSLIEGIVKECRYQGYELLISHLSIADEDYTESISNICSDFTSGLILLATEMLMEDIKLFEKCPYPVILIDNCFREGIYDSVLINNEDAAYKATKYLIDNGHTKIGYLNSSAYINNFYYRKQGYLEAIKEGNLVGMEAFHVKLAPSMDGAYLDMLEFLNSKSELPTAFFADNDTIAFGAMKALMEKGYKIPEDISIIGFDDMPFCEITSPRLTTIKVYKQEMGSLAVKRLIKKLESSDTIIQKTEIYTELIIRDSVKDIR